MKVINYLRKHGIKHAFDVLWQNKIDLLLQKVMLIFLKKTTLQDIIMIESHNDFDSNGGAFYNYLIQNGFNKKYKIVWLLKQPELRPPKLPKNVEWVPLLRPNLKKDYYICVAKYFTADNTTVKKWREGQLSIFLGHGMISLKETRGLTPVPDYIDYVVSPSERYDELLAYELSMEYPTKRFIHTGYPCEDVYFSEIDDEYIKFTEKSYSKKILWMPTFRKGRSNNRVDSDCEQEFGVPLFSCEDEFEEINQFLAEQNVLFTIKIHPMQDPKTIERLKGYSNICILTGDSVKRKGIDNYRLMASSDALISDYSSSAYSFLLLNRPLAFVLEDLEHYKLGLCVENVDDYLVGEKIYSLRDLQKFLINVVECKDDYKEQRLNLRECLYEHLDGKSSERLIKFMEK